MMRSRLLLLVLLIATMQTGCFVYSHPSYPENWVPVDSHTEICGVLPGNYKNSGQDGEPERHAPPLAMLLFRAAKPATNVRIQKKGEAAFLLTAESSGITIASRTIDGKCGSQQLSVPPMVPDTFLLQEGVLAYEKDTVELSVAADGALVAHSSTGGVGLMLGIPAGGSESRWFRYPPAEKEFKGPGSQ